MKLHKYQSINEYKKIQSKGNKAKLGATWVFEDTIKTLAAYVKSNMPGQVFGICHGTRRGNEQRWFLENLDNAKVIGTEISDTATKFEHTIQWDFHEVKDEWIGNVDFIYSNSMDHSYDPKMCLDQWMKCIKKESGVCFIEWTNQHNELHTSQYDCFGAAKEEYIKMIEEKYSIKDQIIFETERRGEHTIFVVTHKTT